jgi:hypothetical protein
MSLPTPHIILACIALIIAISLIIHVKVSDTDVEDNENPPKWL